MEADTGEQRWLRNFNFSEAGLGFALELTLPQNQLYFQQVWLSREKCRGAKLSSFSNYGDSQTLLAATHLITIRFVEPLLLWCPSLGEPCTPKTAAPLLSLRAVRDVPVSSLQVPQIPIPQADAMLAS